MHSDDEPLTSDPGDEGDDNAVKPEDATPVKEHELEDAPETEDDGA